MPKKTKYGERMRDAVSFRVTDRQRQFLEAICEQRNIGLCEAARSVLDEAMARAGAC